MASSSSSTTTASTSQTRCTHHSLHIRSAHEAHTLFEAVRLGLLPIVRRRLSPTDKELESGEVFVWEEASYKGGLERWTDGKKWSQSRMREPFLFYEEKAMPSREEREAKIARRACRSLDTPSPPTLSPSPAPSSSTRRRDRPSKLKGLTKQTYSAYVHTGEGQPTKKWHLTAYFCGTTYRGLPTVADDPILKSIVVPRGVYVTGKGLTRNQRRSGTGTGEGEDGGMASTAVVVPPPSFPSASRTSRATASLVIMENAPSEGSISTMSRPPTMTRDFSSSPSSIGGPRTPPLSTTQRETTTYHAPQPQYPAQLPLPIPLPSPSPMVAIHTQRLGEQYNEEPQSHWQHYPGPEPHYQQKPPYVPPPYHHHHQAAYPPPHPLPQQQLAAYPPPPPHAQYTSPTHQHAYIGYPSSDVRHHYPPTLPPAPPVSLPPISHSPPQHTHSTMAPPPPLPHPSARYAARHTLDRQALGAFRVQL